MNQNSFRILFLTASVLFCQLNAKSQEDSSAPVPVVKLRYYNINNHQQYLLLESNLKKDKMLTTQSGKKYELYLDSSAATNLVGTLITDVRGNAKTFIPPALKAAWDSKAQHVFIVKSGEEEVITDFTITKGKIILDTSSSDGVRSITVSVKKQTGNDWTPVSDVEMKVGISRLGGILSAGDEPTYTTDSSGTIVVEVKKDSLPGDEKGNIILAAKVEDHEELGNLQIEKVVPWGVALKADKSFFDKRTLWSTRFRTPAWLLIIAYSIVLSVWGTLIYLVLQLIKIKKLGKKAASS